jgi:hypothetical protein
MPTDGKLPYKQLHTGFAREFRRRQSPQPIIAIGQIQKTACSRLEFEVSPCFDWRYLKSDDSALRKSEGTWWEMDEEPGTYLS